MSPFNVALLLVLASIASSVHGIRYECKTGETKQEDCNTCKCMGAETYGLWGCTLKSCPPSRAKRGVPRKDCEPGTRKMNNCNRCFCAGSEEYGYGWACTLMGCGIPSA